MREKVIELGNEKYKVEREYRNAFVEEDVQNLYTDYFQDFDYIFGDYSGDRLRLKGFYDKTNKNVKKINSIEGLDEYIKNFCSYECRYFLLKKVKK